MKLLRVNDLQIKESSPFYESKKDFFEWLLENKELNNTNTNLILTGDIFDKSHPTPKENKLILNFIENSLYNKIYLLTGNHDYSIKTGNALKALDSPQRVHVISQPEILELENYKILALPHMYDCQLNSMTVKQYYENLPSELSGQHYDKIIYHFEDKTSEFKKGAGIDISYLKTDSFDAGHIHTNFNDHYKGVPIITRYDERGHIGTVLLIDTFDKSEKMFTVPKFLDYVEVTYPDDLVFNDISYPIFNIHEVPTKNIAENYYREKYNDRTIYFRSFYKKKEIKQVKDIDSSENNKTLSLLDYFENAIVELIIDKDIANLCRPYINNNCEVEL